MTASNQTRNSPCGNPFAQHFVTSIAQHHLCQSEVHIIACHPQCAPILLSAEEQVMCVRVCVLYLRVRHDAWVSRDVCALSLRVSPDARVSYCLRVSHDVRQCLCVESRCACCCCLLVSPAVCVVCCLWARHHVRVLCLGVHRDVSVFGGNGKEISASVLVILREHKCQPLEKRPWLTSCSGDTILPPPRAGRPCLRLSNTKKILGYPATRTATHQSAKQIRRELRVFFAEAKTQRRHLDFGSGREELSLRSQQIVVPHQQLTDQLLPGSKMLQRQSQSVRDQASRNGTFGVEFWPAVRGANAVFREVSVETIWRLLALSRSLAKLFTLASTVAPNTRALIQSWNMFPSTCAVIPSSAVRRESMTMLSMRKPLVYQNNEGRSCPLSRSSDLQLSCVTRVDLQGASLSQRP